MCIRMAKGDLVFAIADVYEDIRVAEEIAMRLGSYVNRADEDLNIERVSYDLNRMDDALHSARSKNSRLRREVNGARPDSGRRNGDAL